MEVPTNEEDDDLDNVTRAMLEELPLQKVPKKKPEILQFTLNK